MRTTSGRRVTATESFRSIATTESYYCRSANAAWSIRRTARSKEGHLTPAAASSLCPPTSLLILSNGDVYVADGYGNSRIAVFDRTGKFLRQWGRQGTSAEAEAGAPGVFMRVVHSVKLGNDGLVYVCDRQADRIQVFDKMGGFKRNIWIKRGDGPLSRQLGNNLVAWFFTGSRTEVSHTWPMAEMNR